MVRVYTAKNGAKYIKLANGQCRFISGASKKYLNKIRKMRGGKMIAKGTYGCVYSPSLISRKDWKRKSLKLKQHGNSYAVLFLEKKKKKKTVQTNSIES